MLSVVDIPAVASAAILLGFALVIWRSQPICARIVLGAVTAFAIGGVSHPGMSVNDLIGMTDQGIAWVVALARVSAAVAVLVGVATLAREAAFGRF
jgi:hypothetical protein